MCKKHPRWREFLQRLEGREGCYFRERIKGNPETITWRCDGSGHHYAVRILRKMGFDEDGIGRSVEWFEAHGGHCDCEIVFNCGR
jgi:hypothetical protein